MHANTSCVSPYVYNVYMQVDQPRLPFKLRVIRVSRCHVLLFSPVVSLTSLDSEHDEIIERRHLTGYLARDET